ncbi:MAG TPA: hypothetical protein VIK27_12905 [Candidatus Aquilonibacter sp.]
MKFSTCFRGPMSYAIAWPPFSIGLIEVLLLPRSLLPQAAT